MIHYTIYKNDHSNQWVTFVHGAGGSSSIWFKQIRDFQKEHNLIVLDLRGHGGYKTSSNKAAKDSYTFPALANDILEVLDYLKIQKSHFVGISLGTILIRQLAQLDPKRVQSMSMCGAILKINFCSQILMALAKGFRFVLPYLILYRFFAFVIMPKKNHKPSRILFIKEAKKMGQKEFMKWFKLTTEINRVLKKFRKTELPIPTLYLMGQEDYLFLPSIRKEVRKQHQTATLYVVQNSGHVVNVEQPSVFNTEVLSFIKSTTSNPQ